jgi:hypothetical protein
MLSLTASIQVRMTRRPDADVVIEPNIAIVNPGSPYG